MPKLVFAEIALKCQRSDADWGHLIEEVFIKSKGIEYRNGEFISWGYFPWNNGDTVQKSFASENGNSWAWGSEIISPSEHYKFKYTINRVTGAYERVLTYYKTKGRFGEKVGTTVGKGSCELLKRKF